MTKLTGIWSCKIGQTDQEALPDGADWPLRQAVSQAYYNLTGRWPDFIFSGWNAQLTEGEQDYIDNKEEEKRNG